MKTADMASAENSVNISGKRQVSEFVVKEVLVKSEEAEYSKGMEEEQKKEQECENAEKKDHCCTSTDMGAAGVERGISHGPLNEKHMSAAQKRKINVMQAMVVGQTVLPKAERKKLRLEKDNQKSEISDRDAKKLKTNTNEKEGPAQQNCTLGKMNSVDVTNTNCSVDEEFSEKGTGVSSQEETVGLMRYAITLEGFPYVKMTEEQAEMVVISLMERIKPSDQGEPIEFSATRYENGGLALTCVNSATKAWLFMTIYKIVPWPGARLEIGWADFILKGAKCILWVMMSRSNQQILGLLEKQNKDISTAKWKVLRRVAEADKRERLTLWVDDKSLEDLRARNFKLFLGFNQANLMLASEWKKMMSSCSSAESYDPWPAVQNPQQPPTNYKLRKAVVPKSMSQNFPQSLALSSGPQESISKEVKLGEITNTNDSVTEKVGESGTSALGRESGVKEEMFDWMRLAVVLEGFPDNKMTEEQAEVVGTVLVEQINPSDEGEPIQFSAMQYENGGLVLTCVNETTKKWMNGTVRNIVPWPGAKLVLGQAELMLKGIKFVLWVMRVMRNRSNEQILDLIQKQNKGISTAKWKVIRRVAEGDKTTGLILWVDNKSDITTAEWKVLGSVPEPDKRERLTVWVDNESSEDLKEQNFKLFLGLDQVKLMMSSEWKKLVESCGSTRRTFKLRSLIPDPGSLAGYQSNGPGNSGPIPHPRVSTFRRRRRPQRSELEFSKTNPPHFRKLHFMASDRILPREQLFTESAVQQNLKSRFLASEQRFENRFGTSEWSQSRGASPIISNRAQRTEPGYTSGQSLENRYIASDDPHSHKTRYHDSPQLHEKRFMVSDQAPSCNSRPVPPNQDQLENLTFIGMEQPLSLDSRFRGLVEPPSQESRFQCSDQMQCREDRFMEQDLLYSRESRSRLSDPKKFGQFDNTVFSIPNSQEDKISGSAFLAQQPMSSDTSWTHSYFSRPSESSRANW